MQVPLLSIRPLPLPPEGQGGRHLVPHGSAVKSLGVSHSSKEGESSKRFHGVFPGVLRVGTLQRWGITCSLKSACWIARGLGKVQAAHGAS